MLGLRDVTVRYGKVTALDQVSLDVADGERLAVLGPSGSGKSSLLRVVAGLEPPATGTVAWDGQDLAASPVHARGFGLMFQDYVLFPNRDVAGNVAFGLEMSGTPAQERGRRVAEVLELVGLTGYDRRAVTELSGGEQQRVALARALAPRPRLLMLDEPLGALDRSLRERLLGDLLEIIRRVGLTTIYVTHDQEEALAMGDRVAILRRGRLEAIAAPAELWQHPPSEFVARFLGFGNIVDAEVADDGLADTPWGTLPVPSGTMTGRHRLMLRPEGLRLAQSGAICGRVASATFRGSRTVTIVAVDGAPSLEVHAAPAAGLQAGERVCVDVPAESVIVLPASSGATLRQ